MPCSMSSNNYWYFLNQTFKIFKHMGIVHQVNCVSDQVFLSRKIVKKMRGKLCERRLSLQTKVVKTKY